MKEVVRLSIMRIYIFLFILIFPWLAYTQINRADSTVQVIAYWSKGEKHSYNLSYDKFKVVGTDTLTTQDIKYKADFTVIDSTSSGYLIEWKYRDYSFGNVTGKEIEQNGMGSIIKVFEKTPILFLTDQNGSFIELKNWEEVRDKFKSVVEIAKNTLKLPEEYTAFTSNLTREHIEELTIKDVQMFCMFYGLKLNLGVPIEKQFDSGNETTGPIISDISLLLQEIDFEEELYNISFYQNYDQAAIQKSLASLLSPLLSGVLDKKGLDAVATIKFKSFEDFYTGIFHDSGWPVSMQYDRVIVTEKDEEGIERRTIQLAE